MDEVDEAYDFAIRETQSVRGLPIGGQDLDDLLSSKSGSKSGKMWKSRGKKKWKKATKPAGEGDGGEHQDIVAVDK